MTTDQTIALAGLTLTLTIAIVGYFVRRLHTDVQAVDMDLKQLDQDVATDRKDNAAARAGLRTEFNSAIFTEEVRRKEADSGIEMRTNTAVQRLVEEVRINHADTKSDLRSLTEYVRSLATKRES